LEKVKNIRIAIASNSYFPFTSGGRETWLFEVIHKLPPNYKITIFGAKPPSWPQVNPSYPLKRKIQIIHIPSLLNSPFKKLFKYVYFSFINYVYFCIRCAREIKKMHSKFDIIISLNHGLLSFLLVKNKIKKKLPVLIISHGFWSEEMKRNVRLLSPLLSFIEKNAIIKCDLNMFLTKSAKNYQEVKYKIEIPRSTILPNAIDVSVFNPKNFNEELSRKKLGFDKNFIITIISTIRELKGQKFALLAMPTIKEKIPNVKLLVVGKGSTSRLERLAKKLKVEDHVSFLGERTDIPLILSGTHIFLLPSLHEGLPISILEAMAMTKPVVATNVGLIPEIITNRFNGLLIPPKDINAITQAILGLFSDKKLMNEFGKNARKTVIDKSNWDKTIIKLNKIIKFAIKK